MDNMDKERQRTHDHERILELFRKALERYRDEVPAGESSRMEDALSTLQIRVAALAVMVDQLREYPNIFDPEGLEEFIVSIVEPLADAIAHLPEHLPLSKTAQRP